MFKMKYLAMAVVGLGIISLIIGGAFIGLAVQKNNFLSEQLREQNITLGLTTEQVAAGQVVDSSAEAQTAAAVLAEHLKRIAPTYSDLMSANPNGRFNPTNPTNVNYAQGLNLQNSMNMAVLGFGVVHETMATGGALAVIGIAVGALGLILFRMWKRQDVVVAAPLAQVRLTVDS